MIDGRRLTSPAEKTNLLNHKGVRMEKMLETPPAVRAENIKFYTVTQMAYLFGASGHLGLGFFFLWLKVYEMACFNFILSVPVFFSALILNRLGRHELAFSLAFFELFFHQLAAVYFLGWQSGFQYYLIYLAALTFFDNKWNNRIRILLILTISCGFVCLYFFCETPAIYRLSKPIYHLFYLFNSLSALVFLALLIHSYVKKADEAESGLREARKKSEEMGALLKKMFGRYLSPEVMNSLLEEPASLELGGEKRSVTIMMTDLRGFTALCERLEPEQVVRMLNGYFEVMMEVIDRYQGTINEIIGDTLLVIFGAPREMPDRSQRAVACAIEMQNVMDKVNKENRSNGLPELEMGIGLNETEVIVGNIGSSKRSKYAVVGSGVNVASRIESYTVGGQILVSESVYREAGPLLRVDGQRDVVPKGAETPLRIYEVGGISGPYNLALEEETRDPLMLSRPIQLKYRVLEGKNVVGKQLQGVIMGLSGKVARMVFPEPPALYSNLKMSLDAGSEKLSARHFYGKVIQNTGEDGACVIRFTSMPPEVDSYFQACVDHAGP